MNTPKKIDNHTLANIRHELRTPVNAIIGYSEMLIEDLEEQDVTLISQLEKIKVGGYELLSLIAKNLERSDHSQEETLPGLINLLEKVEIDLSPSLNKILSNCENLLREIEEPDIVADLTRIQTAGQNLSNLIADKNTYLFQGITEIVAEPSPTYISNVNNPDINTADKKIITNPIILTEQYQILVVDDQENNRDLLSRQLEKENYKVATIDSGKKALKLMETNEYDLILLDLLMPELDGSQVLEIIKSTPQWQHIPVIMISALDEVDSIVRCIEMGAEDYLPKPFNPVLLRARMGACLEKKRFRDREKKYLQQVEEYSQKLNKELEIGRTMQQNFLPASLPTVAGWEFASFFKPARQVAGDFYDVFPLSDNNMAIVIADVCDKGVGAALFMALFRSLIRIFTCENQWQKSSGKLATIPANLLGDRHTYLAHIEALHSVILTNNYVAENHGDLGMFATLFLGILDTNTGLITYINGGHESLFLINSKGEIKGEFKSTGPALGMLPDINFDIKQNYLEPGEILFAYTDGVTEARSLNKEFFTDKRLKSLISEPESSACKMIDSVSAKLLEYIGDADQFDDITMLAIQRS